MLNIFLTLLAQFLLAAAAPVGTVHTTDAWQAGTGGGIVGFIVLVLDIIAWSRFI